MIPRTPDLFTCPDCHDRGWVCDFHEHEPWPHDGCPGMGAVCEHPGCYVWGLVRPADGRKPYQVRDERRVRCFLAPGADMGEPCWGQPTIVHGVTYPDEGGGTPGDIVLCQGHLPVYSGQPYRPEPQDHDPG